MAFAADDDTAGLAPADGIDGLCIRFGGCVERELKIGEPGCGDERNAEERPGGGAEGFGVVRAGGTFQEHNSGSSERLGGADDSAGVTGILEAVENDNESRKTEEIFHFPFRETNEGEDSLWCLSGRKGRKRDGINRKDTGRGVGLARGLPVLQRGFGADYGVYEEIAAIGLVHQMEAFDDGEPVLGANAFLNRFADGGAEGVAGAEGSYVDEHSSRMLRIPHKHLQRWIRLALALAVVGLMGWLSRITFEIHKQSVVDEAAAADVIVIMGAAEYRGKPSPVLRARLDHGLDLFQQGLARRILTTGGAGGDPVFTEGIVGRNYLMNHGVPPEAIMLEGEGETTAHSTTVAAEIMRRSGLKSCILVSDGYHIYRAKKMLEFRGLQVFGSPRAIKQETGLQDWWLYFRQAVGFVLWTVGITI